MANIPSFKRIRNEELKDAPEELKNAFNNINLWTENSQRQINGGIGDSNLNGEPRTLNVEHNVAKRVKVTQVRGPVVNVEVRRTQDNGFAVARHEAVNENTIDVYVFWVTNVPTGEQSVDLYIRGK